MERIGVREQADGTRVPINPHHQDTRLVELAPVKTIGECWHEWVHGIGGRKPARLFDRNDKRNSKVNTNYYKRKVVWDVIGNLVRAGKSEATAIRVVEKHYKSCQDVIDEDL